MAALHHITVLDLSRVRAGPAAARQLADWGAKVIKIEAPVDAGIDDGLGSDRHGPDFQNLHRGKQSLTLNLKTQAGIEILHKLVATADVLVENFRPDVKYRLGIDYARLEAINPRLIYASISGFGQDGPYRLRPGYDQIAQGMGGLMSVTGLPGEGPVRAGIPVADLSAGLYCASGILLALLERERSGRGQWVSTSLLEAQIAMMDFQAARWLIAGEIPAQVGNGHPTTATMGVFQTADVAINIAVGYQAMWETFCRTIGFDRGLSDPDFADQIGRNRHRTKLVKYIDEALAEKPASEWIAILNEAGIPCGPIYTMDQVFDDPQVRHLTVSQPVSHPDMGQINVVGQPVHLSRTPSRLTSAAPEAGQHTAEILVSLGYTETTISALREAGAI